MLVLILNGIINTLTFILDSVFGLLPNTPFDFKDLSWGDFGLAIGYIFPISSMFTHMLAITSAFGIYYLYRHILRLIRMIR